MFGQFLGVYSTRKIIMLSGVDCQNVIEQRIFCKYLLLNPADFSAIFATKLVFSLKSKSKILVRVYLCFRIKKPFSKSKETLDYQFVDFFLHNEEIF